MIIDSHIHFGKAMNWDLPEQDLIRYIYEYNIDCAIISNVSGIEFEHPMKKIDRSRQYPQIQLNKRTAELVKAYPSKLKGLCWIKPHFEGYTKELETFLEENKAYFCGVKIHPYHSAIKLTDKRIIPYILLCRKFSWPCVIHSGEDCYASPENVYEIAKVYSDVEFIMVHIEKSINDVNTISFIKELPNLYADTTWMNTEAIVKTVTVCGSHKVLFGTHAIMQGLRTTDQYIEMIDYLKTHLTGKELEDLFYKNAIKLFKLDLTCQVKKVFY